jgi:hypothetical protein
MHEYVTSLNQVFREPFDRHSPPPRSEPFG